MNDKLGPLIELIKSDDLRALCVPTKKLKGSVLLLVNPMVTNKFRKVRGGPVYIVSEERLRTIGKNHVAVPTHVYKIVYDPSREEAIAFLMPNIKIKTSDMPQYIVSIRTIENETGLDFLSEFDPSIQTTIEANRAGALWTKMSRC